MKTKFKQGDPVKYGECRGKVVNILKKPNLIECIFRDQQGKEFVALFDYEGWLDPCGEILKFPQLEKTPPEKN